MKKWLRNSLFVFLGILFIVFGVLFASNTIIKNKVEFFLENRLPDYISQSYSNIDLDLFEGTITVNKPIVNLKNRNDNNIHTTVSLDKIIIEDLSYWDYLFKASITIEDIKLFKANITYFKDVFKPSKDQDKTKGLIKLYKPILIEELSIDNAMLHIYDKTSDSLLLYVENSTTEIDDLVINNETLKKRLPVNFSEYEFKADSVFLKANDFENLATSSIRLKDNKATFNNVQFKTKYSRTKLSRVINKERDHFNLKLDSLNISGLDFGFINRQLFVNSKAITIANPNFKIFRDKLVEDDLTIKKLYSESIREIPFDLTVDSVLIKDANIEYTEKVKEENNGGSISFQKFYASIYNVSNTYKSPIKTELDITGKFMNVTPFKAYWSFDVNNINDKFIFKMNMDAIAFNEINEFTEPNLKVRLSGNTNKLFFTINGNKNNATVDMKVNYENLEINVLNKNGNKKNWLLSKVANLFVSKDSKDKKDNFRAAKTKVDRDKTKSVFNFIWLNTSEGLLKSMAGDGEK